MSSSIGRAYKNLNKGGLWAIRQKIDGKGSPQVIGYARKIVMTGVRPVVSAARHDAVRAKNTREVFAYLEGDIVAVEGWESFKGRELVTVGGNGPIMDCEKVTFHPFEAQKRGFHWDSDGSDYVGGDLAIFSEDGSVYCA